ncbi:MAG TPA: glycine oxidase ThiO [Thermoanaerobaculia bacterium]|nr:glycine oxidase ThiO [Thermoanaerobaculia bacterium]
MARKGLDVLVVGGGIIGLACARELARAGKRVEVLERLPAGASASVAAAGMLAPLAEVPQPGPFLDACRASRDLWPGWVAALSQETGLSIEFDASGTLLVALDAGEEAHLEAVAAAAASAGEVVEEIGHDHFRQWVPDASPGVRRVLRILGDHRVDNVQACAVLASAALAAGATVSYGFEVERIERTRGGVRATSGSGSREAELLILAAGAWSGQIPGLPPLPVRPVRGQMLMLQGIDWPWHGCIRGQGGYAVRRGLTRLLVGATTEEAGFFCHPTVAGIDSLLAFTRHVLPGLDTARLESVWAGLRPGTPDDLPLIGFLPGWPVLAATGHFRNGILLAPWTAREVARLVAGRDAAPEAASFSPSRFIHLPVEAG